MLLYYYILLLYIIIHVLLYLILYYSLLFPILLSSSFPDLSSIPLPLLSSFPDNHSLPLFFRSPPLQIYHSFLFPSSLSPLLLSLPTLPNLSHLPFHSSSNPIQSPILGILVGTCLCLSIFQTHPRISDPACFIGVDG